VPLTARFGRPVVAIAARAVLLFGFAAVALPASAQAPAPVQRGEYIFHAAGCFGCHTDTKNSGAPLAGGRELKTPFGSFFGPNITPHPEFGIGRWTEAQFRRALREGLRPDGAHYFPAFPYTSFTGMTDADIADLWAYLQTVPAAAQPNRPHELGFPFNIRLAMIGWKALFFTEGAFKPDPAKSAEINRGAYLVNALGHCGECHTPRNLAGGLDRGKWLAGGVLEGGVVPNITPHPETGIGKWSPGDITDLLKMGMTPDGDFVGGEMAEVTKETAKLTDEDVKAIIAYLRSLPPINNAVRKPKS
jgi:mono/diheme cytochrome c family protein